MGGQGSGQCCRWDSKKTTESQYRVDIRWLRKQGYLKSGTSGLISWSCGDEQTGSVRYRIDPDHLVLNYRCRLYGCEWEDVKQEISFDQTPCNYGGYRLWFCCPHCQKRVAILYVTGKLFLCRHCCNLTYACQQESPPFRLTSKAQKIRNPLGTNLCTDEPIIDKPKGMHWKTFERLKKEAYDASDQSWQEMKKMLGALSCRSL